MISESDLVIDRDISTNDDDSSFCWDASISIEVCRSDPMISGIYYILDIIILHPIAREESDLFADRVDEIDSSPSSTTDSLSGLTEDTDSLTRCSRSWDR